MREDLIPMTVGKTIWDELPTANVDTQKLEHLFESRAKDLMTKVSYFLLFQLKTQNSEGRGIKENGNVTGDCE